MDPNEALQVVIIPMIFFMVVFYAIILLMETCVNLMETYVNHKRLENLRRLHQQYADYYERPDLRPRLVRGNEINYREAFYQIGVDVAVTDVTDDDVEIVVLELYNDLVYRPENRNRINWKKEGF